MKGPLEEAGFWVHLPLALSYETDSEIVWEMVAQCMYCKALKGERIFNARWRREGNADVRNPIMTEEQVLKDMALQLYKHHVQGLDSQGNRRFKPCPKRLVMVGSA